MKQLWKLGRICVTLTLVAFVMTCGTEISKPTSSILGKPAEFLHGVWSVEDSWVGCSAFDQPVAIGARVDTICPTRLDYSVEIVEQAQEILTGYYGLDAFPVEIEYYTGFVSDTLIDVFCRGTGQLFPDVCATPVSFHAVGRPDPSAWTMVDLIEMRFVGDSCDLNPGETYTMCLRLVSQYTRLGDAPELCD